MSKLVGDWVVSMKQKAFLVLMDTMRKELELWQHAELNGGPEGYEPVRDTVITVTAEQLFKVMLPKEKCRIVFEFDPDSELVRGYQESLDRLSTMQELLGVSHNE